ncbi:uncharacterized protein ARMOST_17663 [Armillaria ostoyae]|uniref:Uncharacterized protein n=1 Tax=Armillaria ostoyae TaxID=47428 RepID=A0A284RZM4_ARMOS|nr:uncharacterized protein ARMOST_14672 [Armillaria ostoyae]SJL14208.1 uncharacterized protein ARMOST_17663 [Armillaria ostoyae]
MTIKYYLKKQEYLKAKSSVIQLHKCIAAVMVSMGLMIEETQHRMIQEYKETPENPLSLSQQEMQAAYMPCVGSLLANAPVNVEGLNVKHVPLWLSSSLTVVEHVQDCHKRVDVIETQLWEAQCLDGLDTIRDIARTQHESYTYHDRNMHSQAHMTHVIEWMMRLDRHLDAAVAKYRVVCKALLSLRGPGEWENKLKVLHDKDISSMEGAVFTINREDGMEEDLQWSRKKRKVMASEGKRYKMRD